METVVGDNDDDDVNVGDDSGVLDMQDIELEDVEPLDLMRGM